MNDKPDSFNKITGRKVAEYFPNANGVDARLIFTDGSSLDLVLEGDCCSGSYFTNVKQFEELVGSRILDVELRDEQSSNNLPTPLGSDVISWHFLVFKTDKGHVTIDWHNDSNGYYDGWVVAHFNEKV